MWKVRLFARDSQKNKTYDAGACGEAIPDMKQLYGMLRKLEEDNKELRAQNAQKSQSRRDISQNEYIENNHKQPRKQMMKPGKFDGTGSFKAFVGQFETCAFHNGWSNQDCADYLKVSLDDAAAQVLWDLGADSAQTHKELVKRLQDRYGSTGQTETFRTELRCRRRRKNETLPELMQDIRRLMILSYPKATGEITEILARDAFINALTDRDTALKITEREPRDLGKAYRLALRYESYASAGIQPRETSYDDEQQKRRVRSSTTEIEPNNDQSVLRKLDEILRENAELKKIIENFPTVSIKTSPREPNENGQRTGNETTRTNPLVDSHTHGYASRQQFTKLRCF